MSDVELTVPDLGNFTDVAVIEVHIGPGQQVAQGDALLTLETDKATMDVPAALSGRIGHVRVAVGDKVSSGSVIATLAAVPSGVGTAGQEAPASSPAPGSQLAANKPAAAAPPDIRPGGSAADREVDLLVLGGGPGGYTAAFRAADLGRKVVLVERGASLGGVCLNVGCIPSKALLHAARVVEEATGMAAHGIEFTAPRIDLPRLADWKNNVVRKLTHGLAMLAKQRKVEVLTGSGRFVAPDILAVAQSGTLERLRFRHCIIAAGSEPSRMPGLPDDPRIMDSTAALELTAIPARLLVVGGGIIGLEMACVYDGLGAKVTVVELTDQLMPGCDPDLVRPLEKRLKARYAGIHLKTRLQGVAAGPEDLRVTLADANGERTMAFDRVLIAVGRRPLARALALDAAGVAVDERGFIPVDRQMRTNVSGIFAIGDIVGQPMLAHKATHEGKVAAEVACGERSSFDARVIPSVAYTDPEIAWVGLTETAAREQGLAVEKSLFPWAASGRALASGRDDGFTKLIVDPTTRRVLGGGIVGINAGELIGEIALAIEMGADAADIGLTIHPHPTLSETIAMAAEAAEGTLTDLYQPKRRS
ncbi:MAG: dihydrolipoyl dehydrogenase [Steroidobacteraceae bacterium]